jgi:hypothetical protein
MLSSAGLVGAVVYYDGMHNDAQVNLALFLAAIKNGAVPTNNTAVIKITKGREGYANRRHRAGYDDGRRAHRACARGDRRDGAIHRCAPRSRLLQLPFLLRSTQTTSTRIGGTSHSRTITARAR